MTSPFSRATSGRRPAVTPRPPASLTGVEEELRSVYPPPASFWALRISLASCVRERFSFSCMAFSTGFLAPRFRRPSTVIVGSRTGLDTGHGQERQRGPDPGPPGSRPQPTSGPGGGAVQLRSEGRGAVLNQLPPAGLSELLSSGPEVGGASDGQTPGHRAPPGGRLLPGQRTDHRGNSSRKGRSLLRVSSRPGSQQEVPVASNEGTDVLLPAEVALPAGALQGQVVHGQHHHLGAHQSITAGRGAGAEPPSAGRSLRHRAEPPSPGRSLHRRSYLLPGEPHPLEGLLPAVGAAAAGELEEVVPLQVAGLVAMELSWRQDGRHGCARPCRCALIGRSPAGIHLWQRSQ